MASGSTSRRPIDEPVRLTRIYTRAGDAGATSLGNGVRVSKADARVEAYGAVDELNAAIGLAVVALGDESELRRRLGRIQNELFDLGADLAVPIADGRRSRLRIEDGQVEALESFCDELNAGLPPLRSFVLPGGSETAARLHVARTVCRRAERRTAALAEYEEVGRFALAYLNRLGDLLFVLARTANADSGAAETLWRPGASTRARAEEGIFA